MTNKSNVGPFEPSQGQSSKNSFSLSQKDIKSLSLLKTDNVGWSQNIDKEFPQIISATGVATNRYNKGLACGINIDVMNATNIFTENNGPAALDENTYPLLATSYLEVRFVDRFDGEDYGIALFDDELDSVIAMKAVEDIKIYLRATDTVEINIFNAPIIANFRIVKYQSNHYDNHLYMTFYIPCYIDNSANLDFTTSSCVKYNGDWIDADEISITARTPTNRPQIGNHEELNNKYEDDVAGSHLVRNFNTSFYSKEIDVDDHLILTFSLNAVGPLSPDNNLSEITEDSQYDYHRASCGTGLLKLQQVEHYDDSGPSTSSVGAEDTENVLFADETYIFDVDYDHMQTYEYEYNDDIRFGIGLEADSDNNVIAESNSVIPYIEYDEKRYYVENIKNVSAPFNLLGTVQSASRHVMDGGGPIPNTTEIGPIDYIKLKKVRTLSNEVNRVAFCVHLLFSYAETYDDDDKYFIFDFHKTDSFSGGNYIAAIDNQWRLYCFEILNDDLVLGNQEYYYPTESVTLTDIGHTCLPKFSKELLTSVYSGGKEYLGKLFDISVKYSTGYYFPLPDISMSDNPVLSSRDIVPIANKGFSIPILFPSISLYNGNADTVSLYNTFWYTTTMYLTSKELYGGGLAVACHTPAKHTYHLIPTKTIAAGNVWNTLPPTAEELLGNDIAQYGALTNGDFIQIGNNKYVPINNMLYKSLKSYHMSANLSEQAVYDSGTFYTVGNFLFVAQDSQTMIYVYSEDNNAGKFNLFTSVPAKLSSEPIIYNKNVVMPMIRDYKDLTYFNIVIMNNDGYILAHEEELSGLNETATHYLDNGELCITCRYEGDSEDSLKSYIIANDLSIISNDEDLSSDEDSFFAKYNVLNKLDAKVYKTSEGDIQIKSFETAAADDYQFTTGVLDIYEQYQKAFVAYKLVILMDKEGDTYGNINVYLGINDDIPESASYTVAGEQKVEIDITMKVIKYLAFKIITASDSPVIRDIYLVGYFLEGE